MANTTNLNLVKPAGTDFALVSVINGNMDIIDSKVGAIPANESAQSQITALNNQIATNNDTTAYTKLSDIKTALNTLADTLPANQTKYIRIHTGTDTSLSPFTAWNDFIGYMQKQSSGYWIATLVGRDGVDVTVTNSNGTINAYSLSNQLEISSGTVTEVKALTTSGTYFDYTVATSGWYTVKASTANTSGSGFGRIAVGNTVIMQVSASLGQYDNLLPSPVFLKAGTAIKGMAGFPTNGSGAIVRIS